MSDPYVGEIKMFAGNFAPRSWAFCDGQLLSVSQYDALFSLLGTIYGGDGRTTFGLPDLRGRVPMHQGTGAGLTRRRLGERGGAETVSLAESEIPAHTHTPRCVDTLGNSGKPTDKTWAADTSGFTWNYHTDAPDANMNANAIGSSGANQGHANMAPFLGIHFIIAVQGIYPSR
jgi:microcystin-dependent protein